MEKKNRCVMCGKQCRQKFCSRRCKNRFYYERKKERWANRPEAKNRPYTADTVYLVTKWHLEGLGFSEIAVMLQRSDDNIARAWRLGTRDKEVLARIESAWQDGYGELHNQSSKEAR